MSTPGVVMISSAFSYAFLVSMCTTSVISSSWLAIQPSTSVGRVKSLLPWPGAAAREPLGGNLM